MSNVIEFSEAAILGRVIRPESGDWSQDAALAILNLGFSDEDRERMTELLEKAKDGNLLAEERDALEHYLHIGRLLELMKSRARRSLNASSAA